MKVGRKKHFNRATVAYFFLLAYIVAALVWWFISLQRQSNEMAQLKLDQLYARNSQVRSQKSEVRSQKSEVRSQKSEVGSQKSEVNLPAAYEEEIKKIEDENKRAHGKYIGEGATFLLLSLAGAYFVYRSARKQVSLQQQESNFMMAITHELKT